MMPSLKIHRSSLNKILGWTRAADSEVSGLGLVALDGKDLVVYDAMILKQKCGFAHTTFLDTSIPELQYSLHKQKKNLKHLRFWWHTHYTFNPFWSLTDEETAKRLTKNSGDWFLSMVLNQKGEFMVRLDSHKEAPFVNHGLDLEVVGEAVEDKTDYKSDISKNVSKERTVWGVGSEDGWEYDAKRGVFKYTGNAGVQTDVKSSEGWCD